MENAIIAMIRTEIERQFNLSNEKRGLARRSKDYYNEVAYGAQMDVCNRLLSFLSNLEKSVKPKNFDFNYEFSHFLDKKDEELGSTTWSEEDLQELARHFYDLGCIRTAEKYDEIEYNRKRAEESEKPMNQEELEEEIRSYADYCEFDFKSWDYDTLDAIARHFAQWGAEHLKK